MGHHSARDDYEALTRRINLYPQGAPPSELLIRILSILFPPDDAARVALLPVAPFRAAQAAAAWSVPETQARVHLEALADRGLLLDVTVDDDSLYVLPPPMAGFFEFSMMRVRHDVDQKLLAELFYQYLNVEEDFVRELFTGGTTHLGRIFVDETVLPRDGTLEVLDHERATHVVTTASHRAVGVCYCRHKMSHLDRACDAPLDVCLTLGNTARSLLDHGLAREASPQEAVDIITASRERGLVQFGENVRQGVAFICNCCGCCCEALQAVRRFGHLHPVHTTNYIPVVDEHRCTGCGRCVRRCPVEALSLTQDAPARVRVNDDRCLGCGVCVRQTSCPALTLAPRGERVLTPLNSTHRAVLMAIERGKLQNLLFDEQAFLSHRVMAAILGVILRLPPVKQVMASRQMKSRYLEWLAGWWHARRRASPDDDSSSSSSSSSSPPPPA